MPTNTYTPIGSVTLATATSEVTFTVPTGYGDLVLVFAGDGNSGGADISLRLNGDTGANYSRVYMIGAGSGSGASGANSSQTKMDAITAANGRQINLIVNLMDASATDKHKTVLTRDNDSGFQVGARAFRWANTNAITNISMLTSAGQFTTGSTFNLFGIVA